MKKSIIFALILFMSSTSFGQMEYKRFSLDLNGGLPFVYGDITTKLGGYNATGRLNYSMTRSFSVGAEFSYGEVSGLNKDTEAFYFTNQYMKGFLGVQMYFFNAMNFHELSKWFQPYVGVGLGLVKSNMKESGSVRFGVKPELSKEWIFGSQVNAGVKFKLSKFLDLNTVFSVVNMKSDNFDNHVPRFFVNNYNDVLSTAEIGLTFHLGGKGKEPLIWSVPPCYAPPADNSKIDSLLARLSKLEDKVDEEEEEVDSLGNENLSLSQRVDSLQQTLNKSMADFLDCCNSNKRGDGADGYIYEAELEGPIQAEYYIVSGSYAILSNATNRIQMLSELGYTAYIMREPSVGLNRVVIDHTDIYNEAIEKVAKYRIDLDPKSWIIKQAKK
jgi:opacity protein-like surface antigen